MVSVQIADGRQSERRIAGKLPALKYLLLLIEKALPMDGSFLRSMAYSDIISRRNF